MMQKHRLVCKARGSDKATRLLQFQYIDAIHTSQH